MHNPEADHIEEMAEREMDRLHQEIADIRAEVERLEEDIIFKRAEIEGLGSQVLEMQQECIAYRKILRNGWSIDEASGELEGCWYIWDRHENHVGGISHCFDSFESALAGAMELTRKEGNADETSR